MIWLSEDIKSFKDLVSCTQQENVLYMGNWFFGAFISSASQIMKGKNYCQKHWGNYTLSIAVPNLPKSWPLSHSYTTNFSFIDNSKLANTMLKVFISRPVVICKLELCQVFNNNPTLTGKQWTKLFLFCPSLQKQCQLQW